MSQVLAGNKLVDQSDVVEAMPADDAAPTTHSFSTYLVASMDWTETTARRHEKRYRFDGIHFITCLAVAWYLSIWPVSLMLLHQRGDNHAITYVLVNQALKNNPMLLAITNCVISTKGF